MKSYATADIRTFAIVGHPTAGKTMLAEAMLVCGGVINRLGSIANGTTMSDYHPAEKARQISIYTTPLYTEWLGKKLNILDCPGYVDFIAEALSGLRVSDLAVVVVHPIEGVGVSTENIWKYVTEQGLPRILVLNMLDKEHVKPDEILQQLKDQFGNKVFPLTVPINPGPGFNQVLDVLRNKVLTYAADGSAQFTESDPEGEWADRAQQLHQQLIEIIAESDDSLLEKFFEQEGLSEEEFQGGIHNALMSGGLLPVFCTSAEKNVGVTRLMDFIAQYGPSLLDRQPVKALDLEGKEVDLQTSEDKNVLFVYKSYTEEHIGELSYFRVYSGKIRSGLELANTNRNTTERIGQLFLTNGKQREQVEEVVAGDLAVAVKLKSTRTGDFAIPISTSAYLKSNTQSR